MHRAYHVLFAWLALGAGTARSTPLPEMPPEPVVHTWTEPDPLWMELAPFPCLQDARGQLDLAEAHLDWLDGQLDLVRWRRPELARWRKEAVGLRDCWQSLAWARDRDTDDWWRRHELDRLRRLLGSDAYRSGRMPPALPCWRFTRQ